jgi:anion-transporting  ArsA/GET3 family ATPase
MAPLAQKRLIIVSGKGGVGKSTTAAALGLSFAEAGEDTLLCEVNAEERLTALLGSPAAGPQLLQLSEHLWSVNVKPAEAMREYAMMVLKYKAVYRTVFENRWVSAFLRFIPSLSQLVMLGKILYHLEEKRKDGRWRFQRVVMDAPATGHAISFLSVPHVLQQTVPPGTLSSEAKRMEALLTNPSTTGALLVTQPEEMPVNETLELHRALTARDIPVAAAVLNGCTEGRFSKEELHALLGEPELASFAQAHAELAQATEEAKRRLESAMPIPLVRVPRGLQSDARPSPQGSGQAARTASGMGSGGAQLQVRRMAEQLRPLWRRAG